MLGRTWMKARDALGAMKHHAWRFLWTAVLVMVLPSVLFAQVSFATSENSTLVPLPTPAFIEPGDTIHIHVRNGPGDAIPFNHKITATIATSRGDIETIYLFETDQDSVYTGHIQTKFGPAQLPVLANNGILDVRGSDTITVTSLAFPAITATVRTNGTLKILEPGEKDDLLNQPNQPLADQSGELKLLTVGKSMLLRVIDDDQNKDPGVRETVQVVVTSSAGDAETVTLTETTADSGIFMAILPTDFQAAPTANNGFLSIQAGSDSVIATYTDPSTTNGTPPLPAVLDVRGGIDSGPNTFSPNPLIPGSDLRITINDTDEFADVHAGPGNDTVTVTVTSFDAGGAELDRETFVVPEDNRLAALFVRSIPYEFRLPGAGPGTDNNGILSVQAGGRVEGTYNDALRANGQVDLPVQIDPLPLPVTFANTPPTANFAQDADCTGTVARIEPGDTVFLCVHDVNADLTPNSDTVTVTLVTERNPDGSLNPAFASDTENVVLNETGPRTGVFTGRIQTKYADAVTSFVVQNNGNLDVRGRDFERGTGNVAPQIRGTYTSPSVGTIATNILPVNPITGQRDISQFVNIDGSVVFTRDGALGLDGGGATLFSRDGSIVTAARRLEFRAGDRLFLRLVDDDLNRDPTVRDTVQVTLTSFDGNPPPASPIVLPAPGAVDQELVTLQETDVNSGVFTVLVPAVPFNGFPTQFLAAGLGTPNNGILSVRAVSDAGGLQTNTACSVVMEYADTEITSSAGAAFPRDTVLTRKGADATVAVVDPNGGGVAIGGDRLQITITGDRDAALVNPAVASGIESSFEAGPGNETRTVTVSSFSGPAGTGTLIDQETIVVAEDNVIEGNFLGLLSTRYRTSTAVPPVSPPVNDGVLELNQGGSIIATFTDYLTNDGQPDKLIASPALTVAAAVAGSVTIVNTEDPALSGTAAARVARIQPGDEIFIRVQDQDLRVVPNGATNQVTVTVLSVFRDPGTGLDVIEDSEVVNLNTTSQLGVFSGHIQTKFGDSIDASAPPDARPGNGTLEVRGRSRIRVQYIDASPFAIRDSEFGLDNIRGTADDQAPTLVEIPGQVRFMTNGGRVEQQGNNVILQFGRQQALKVFNSIPIDSLSVRAGNPVFAAVIDDDKNTSPTVIDEVAVRFATSAGDTETVTLTETGPDTGVFVLQNLDGIRTQLVQGPPTPGDGILQVTQNGQITVDYVDDSLPTPAVGAVGGITIVADNEDVQIAGDAILTVTDATNLDPLTVKAGNNLLITVTEPVSNEPRFDPNKIDTITVTVTSGGGVGPNSDFETVQLFETDLDSKVFRGFVPTVFSVIGTPTNGILEVANTDPVRRQINVSYTDPQPQTPGTKTGSGAIVPNTSNVLVLNAPILTRLGANAAITVLGTQSTSGDEFVLGDTIRVSVSDPNLAGLALGTVQVTVTAPSGDLEQITLRQVGNTGDFNNDANRLPTTYDQSIVHNDGVLEAVGGATSTTLKGEPITFTYVVGLDAQGQMMTPFTTTMRAFTRATIRFAVDRTQGPPAGAPAAQPNLPAPQPRFGQETDLFTKDDTLTMFQAGDRLFIRVVDPDMNFPANNPQVPNTVRVTLTTVNLGNAQPGDSEVVILTEQPRVNGETVRGVFIGSIVTVFANPPNTTATSNNGVLQLIGHDLVTATYVDVNTNVGNPLLISTITTSTEVKSTGSISIVDSATGITITPIISLMPMPGNQTGFVFIRVVDKDFDLDNIPGTDAGPQITITTDRGDREVIATTESTVTPGEFRGQIPIVFGRLTIPGSGRIEAVGGDLVQACYTDALNISPGFSIERCTSARVEQFFGGTLEVLVPRTGQYQVPNRLEEFIIGEALRIRVRDTDQDLTAGRDAVTVTIVTNNGTKPDSETLVLTETGNSTGVFEGEIPTAFPDIVNAPPNSAARFNNGTLTLTGGDTITITYIDAQDGTGQKNVPIVGTLVAARDYSATQEVSNTAVDNSTITLPNGARLTIPPGALHLKETVTFELKYRTQYIDEFGKLVPPPLNPGVVLVGDSGRVGFYEVRPSNLVFKKLVTFEIPVPSTITQNGSVTMLNDIDRQRLKLFYFDGFDWEPSAGTFFRDATGREFIRAVSNHLTVFTLALDNRPPPSLAGPLLTAITLDKNPFTPNGDGINDNVILQFGLGAAATVTVKVVDVNGDLVRTLLDKGSMQAGFNTLQWDGTYAFSTRTVPPGLYVIVVKADSGTGSDVQSVGVGVMK